MKMLLCVLGLLAFGNAMSADYSVGIENLGSEPEGAGTGLNLYATTETGEKLIEGSPYDLHLTVDGTNYYPAIAELNPAHDFVYVVYEAAALPSLVGFKITPQGLVYQWQSLISSGGPGLIHGATVTVGRDYVIENLSPTALGLFITILNQSGQQIVFDVGDITTDILVSGHISPNGRLYISCRAVSAISAVNSPANLVSVYSLANPVTQESVPLFTSTDPGFVQSQCN